MEVIQWSSWCTIVLDFFVKVEPASATIMNHFKQLLDDAVAKNNLTTILEIKNDLEESFENLTPAQKKNLLKTLSQEKPFSFEDREEKAEIILQKGSIHTNSDYRFLDDYVSYLLEKEPVNEDEIKKINDILIQFHKTI